MTPFMDTGLKVNKKQSERSAIQVLLQGKRAHKV